MFSPDVRVDGFSVADWKRLRDVFAPHTAQESVRDPERPRGGIVVVYDGPHVEKLLHTEAGRLALDDLREAWPLSAEACAHRYQASWCLLMQRGALEAAFEGLGARARATDDLVDQLLVAAEMWRDALAAKTIEFWPRRLQGMPIPTATGVRATMDSVCPVGSAILLVLFENGELHTGAAVRRGPRGIDWVMGPESIRERMGLLSGDWRRDTLHVLGATEALVGRVSLGCFAERETFFRLEVDSAPGAWAKAVALRDVIIQPMPPAVAIPLGFDAGRAAVTVAKTLVDQWGIGAIFGQSMQMVGQMMQAAAAPSSVPFDVLALVQRLLVRDR